MKMKLIKNEKYLHQKFSRKALVPQTTAVLYVKGQLELYPFYM